jgi:diguanylate cyclase (GGDEF)-like protein
LKEKIIGKNQEFINKKLEQSFIYKVWPNQIKSVIFITLFITAAAWGLDIKQIALFNFSDELSILLPLKSMVFLSGIFLILLNLSNSLIRSSSLIACVFIITSGLYITAETIIKSGITEIALSVLVLITLLFYIFYNFKFFLIITANIAAAALFVSGNFFYSDIEINRLIIISVILLAANIAGISSCFKILNLQRKAYFLEHGMDKLKKDITKEKLEQESKPQEKQSNVVNIPEEKTQAPIKSESFSTRLEEEFYRSRRYSTELSVLVAEIDKLDKVIEKLGEKTTESILKDFETTCRKEIRPAGDFFVKTSENQFSFILPSTDEYGAFSLAERIIDKANKKTYKIKDKKLKISINTGIACLENENEPIELFEHAKNALDQSKTKEGSEAVFY